MNKQLKELMIKFQRSSEMLFLSPLEKLLKTNEHAGYIVATVLLVQFERVGLVVNPEGYGDSSEKFSKGRFIRGFKYVFGEHFCEENFLNEVAERLWTSGRCGLSHMAHVTDNVWIYNNEIQEPITANVIEGTLEVHINLGKTVEEIRNAYRRLVAGDGINVNNSLQERKLVLESVSNYSTKIIVPSIGDTSAVGIPTVVSGSPSEE